MFERILVTGYSGFVGPWVLSELRRQFPRARLYGAARGVTATRGAPATPDRHVELDLTIPEQIESAIEASRPDAVVHLASLRLAPLEDLLAVNVVGCERLLAGLEAAVPQARIVVIGSSAELGSTAELDIPLDEDTPCQPVDNYGISKLAQAAVATRRALFGQQIVQLRLFNVLGPGAPESMLAGRCIRQLLAAAAASRPAELEFGPLDTRRDYVDARDVARAVVLALRGGEAGARYHIGSGVSRSGYDLVNALIGASGLHDVTYRVATTARGAMVPWQTADIRQARLALGWQPEIGWQQAVRDAWSWEQKPEWVVELAHAS